MPTRPPDYLPVIMLRENMDDLPRFDLPEGYSMRRHRDGDRETWVRVQQASEPYDEITSETYDRGFGGDETGLRRRQFFLVAPDGRDVGTISAWYDRGYRGRRWGMIHYVAI